MVNKENRMTQDPKTYRYAPWADPVLHLMKPFGIQFKHLAYARQADVHFVANIFRDHRLAFWAHALNEYRKVLRLCDLDVFSHKKVFFMASHSYSLQKK